MLKKLIVRNDSLGGGHFDSTRVHNGKTIKHRATDYEVTEGEPIFAPESGLIERYAIPYASDPKWKGLLLAGDSGLKYKLFYMLPDPDLIGKRVSKGQQIGTAQAISKKYSPKMKDHLHVEIEKDGVRIDPEKHLSASAGTIGMIAFFFDSDHYSVIQNQLQEIIKRYGKEI